MSLAVSTTGILVKRATVAAPTVFTTVAELTSVTPPGKSRNKIETTTHNAGSESFVLGIMRQKDMSFRINWLPDDATHDTIMDDLDGNVRAVWQVAFPSGITMTAQGRVQRFEPADAPPDAAQQADVTIAWASPLVIVLP
jgi:hypothetical protein